MTPPWAVGSPMRAAGLPPIITFVEPMMIESGGPTHVHMLPEVAAGRPAISTVGTPGGRIGPPTCGTTPVTIGQVCMSVTRAAGGIDNSLRELRPSIRHQRSADPLHPSELLGPALRSNHPSLPRNRC